MALSHTAANTKTTLSVVLRLQSKFKQLFKVDISDRLSNSGHAFLHYVRHHHDPVKSPWGKAAGKPTLHIRNYCYKGGLVLAPAAGQVFESAHSYDVISIYPSVIRDCPMPGGNLFWLDQITRDHFGFVKVIARAPEGKLPCLLPIREEGAKVNTCVGHERLFTG